MSRVTRIVLSALLAGLITAGMVAAGCSGASKSDRAAAPEPDAAGSPQTLVLHAPPLELDSPGTGSILIFRSGGAETTTKSVRDLYAVFRRAPRESDARVQEIARADALPELNADPTSGKPIYNDTRLVSGTAARGVYALPTTKQLVCLGVFPNGGGVCSSPGADGLTVGYEIAPNSRPSLIYGLLGDDVRGLDVMVSGVTRQAQLGKNAYVLELAHAKGKRLERLILHLRDGTTTVIELS